ncbi:DUF4397 domain-containing protein [Indibacter alkaliphilus]|nr:DUF4397 domain-containing protein [Indibacter alkaliphilus]
MKRSLMVLFVIGVTTLLNSCLQDRDPVTPPDAAFLTIYHASPDSPDLDIYAESNRINTNPLRYSTSFPYSQFFAAERLLRFTPHNAANTVLETTHTLEKDKVYSIFLVNKMSEIQALKVEDKWEEPTSEKAQIRLAQLSPDSGDLKIKIDEQADFFGESIPFKGITDFKEIEKNKVKITIMDNSGEEVLTIDNLDIRGNRVYTLIIRGFSDAQNGNNPLSAQLLTNYIKF